MFISSAWAQSGADALNQNMLGLLPILLIFAIYYFLIIRPQNKNHKQHQELVNNLRRGDKILTSGGVVAEVKKIVDTETMLVEISAGVEITMHKSYVVQLLNHSVPKATAPQADVAAKPAKKAKPTTKSASKPAKTS